MKSGVHRLRRLGYRHVRYGLIQMPPIIVSIQPAGQSHHRYWILHECAGQVIHGGRGQGLCWEAISVD
jgi:hypothetical protein